MGEEKGKIFQERRKVRDPRKKRVLDPVLGDPLCATHARSNQQPPTGCPQHGTATHSAPSLLPVSELLSNRLVGQDDPTLKPTMSSSPD